MRTLSLQEAAQFLMIPSDDLIRRIESENLPAARIGQDYIFIDTDLADYVRGKYVKQPITSPMEIPKSLPTFAELVPQILRIEESRVQRGEISAKTLSITRNKLDRFILSTFADYPINEIDYMALEGFIETLTDADIQGVAISQYMIVVRKVLKYAQLTNLITNLPQFPKVKTNRISRGAFTLKEYRKLLKTAWRLRDQTYPLSYSNKSILVDGGLEKEIVMPRDMARLIGLMVNGFFRPSDLKFMQHKHIEMVSGEYSYLKLNIPETKRHADPIVTMPPAVGIYRRLLADSRARGYGKPNDYLFLPEIRKNRDHALRHLGFLFNWILEVANLKEGSRGQKRTLYSLRHTCITFRLLQGQGIDLLTLAKNARTSVQMIQKHYASTLNGEMNISLLHSKRRRNSAPAR